MTISRWMCFMLHPCSISSHGEPVEELGMRRRCPLAAEVEDRWNQRAAEVPRPDVVHRNAGRQRIAPDR